MTITPASNTTVVKQKAENAVADVRDYALSRLRFTFPYLKTEALSDILNEISAVERKIVAQEAAMAASQANTYFVNLPVGVRNRIYEFVLISDETIEVQRMQHYRDGCLIKPTPRPALLAVNRQVRSEALPVYYGRNTFAATFDWQCDFYGRGYKTVGSWLYMIGAQQACLLVKLELRFARVGLKQLHIYLPHYYTRTLPATKQGRARTPDSVPLNRNDVLGAFGLQDLGVKEQALQVMLEGRSAHDWAEMS